MMVVTELKMEFQKLKPHIVANSDCKHVDNETFWSDLQSCALEKQIWNALRKLLFAYLTSMFPLKAGMSVLKLS